MHKIKLKDTLRVGKKFCVLPFVNYYTDVKKDRYVCCYASDIVDENKLNQIRSDLLNDVAVNSCNSCYKQEENKIISNRQLAIKDFLPYENEVDQCIEYFQNGKTVTPIAYDLRYSNLCNLECQICNPTVSSSIARARGKIEPFLSYEPEVPVNKNTIRIYLAGGEPFLIKSYVNVLNSIENINCEVVINTNATVLTENMLSALDKFSKITFTISIDGYKELNNQLRKNSNWETITNNIKTLTDRFGGYSCIQVNTVIQRDNINYLLPLGKWVESQGITYWTLTELNNDGEHHYRNCKNITIPDELFELSVVSTNIQNVNLLKKICQDKITNQT